MEEVHVKVRNSFECAVFHAVSLTYQHNSEASQSWTWECELKPGEETSPAWNLGSFPGEPGRDAWDVAVKLHLTDTTVATICNKTAQFQAPLYLSDAGKEVVIEISEKCFRVVKASGDGTDKVRIEVNSNPTRPNAVPYSHMAYVTVRNGFPIPANITLSHQYGSSDILRREFLALPTEAVSEPWPVFYNNWKLYSDHWKLHVTFDLADVFPSPEWTSKVAAPLYLADQGKIVECSVESGGFKMQFATTKSVTPLTTPQGHYTTAFGALKNNFKVPIRTVCLKRSYSAHKTCYVRYDIPVGETSSPFAVEYYNTAFAPFHYWNIMVQLEDGSYYTNQDENQKLYFKPEDANTIHIFGVSDSTFLSRLPSGNGNVFETTMTFLCLTPPHQGRDLALPYSDNAFLVSCNACASVSNSAKYASQMHDLHAQLAQGATVLQMELFEGTHDIVVCGKGLKPLLADQLCYVKEYMSRNYSEVVTLFLSDHVRQERDRIQGAFEKAGLWDQVFFCDKEVSGWTVAAQGWPTLQWMIENKKRLVVFSSSSSGPFPSLWSYVSETVCGEDSVDASKWAYKRHESTELNVKPLMLLNHFPATPAAGKHNKNGVIQKHFNAVQKHCTELPNFVAVEFLEQPGLSEGANMAVLALNKKIQQHHTQH